MVLQPALGFAHHNYYKKNTARGVISYAHIWWGRALMIIGIINGGLGLQLARAPRAFTITYSVIAAVIAVAYTVSNILGGRRKTRRHKKEYNAHYHSESPRVEQYR
jgi:hypothetical protein